MEMSWGLQLFIRDKRKKLRLTAEGAEVYGHLSRIYQDYGKMVTKVEKMKKGLTGKLTIGFLEGQLLESGFKEILDMFSGNYPNIELVLTRDTENGLISRLYDRHVGCGGRAGITGEEKSGHSVQ